MNDATTGKPSGAKGRAETGTDWEALRAMSDEALHAGIEADPDARATDAAFWEGAKVVMPKPKQTVTMRLDQDVLHWLKRQGPGYQTRINAILRAYYEAHQGPR